VVTAALAGAATAGAKSRFDMLSIAGV